MESAFFTVADWVANPRSNSIRRKNRRSVLPPRLMDLLFYFAQHPMEVVSRQEIIDNCWDRDVVTDQAITQAIFELRKFLKDGRSAKEAPEYIKTVPKRGYRLLAPVHQLTVEEYIAATSENGAQGTQVIDDEDVPLAALPKTGQSGASGLVLFLSSMMLAAFVAVSKKREDDK